MKENKNIVVNISTATILKTLAIFVGIVFLYLIKEALAILFISLVVASAIDPMIDIMQRHKIPRSLGIVIIYLVVLIVLSGIVALLIPPLVEQFSDLANRFPQYLSVFDRYFNGTSQSADLSQLQELRRGLQSVEGAFAQFGSGFLSAISGFVGSVIAFLGILVLTFYLTVEEKGMKSFVRQVVPTAYQPYTIQKINHIQMKLGHWLRGQLILSGVIGLLTYIGLLIIGVDYALVIALVAAVTELVPFIGPVIAAVIAIFLAINQSLLQALFVFILFLIIQQLENQVIVPKVMQKAVGLNPIVVLIVLLIGAQLAGVVGMILAVPTATIVASFAEDLLEEKRLREQVLED